MDPNMPLGNAGETPLEAPEQKSPEQLQYEQEKTAFETHMATSGEQIPENFKDAGAYFDSLKEAQKQYTQSRQEVAELNSKVEELESKPTETPLTDQLRIPKPEEVLPKEQSSGFGVDEATYERWGMEFASSGSFTDDTLAEIKAKTGFSDRMVTDYVEGQKAKLREGYTKAAGVVGGQDRLNKIFKWASNNLSAQDMQNVNVGLASPTYEVTLRGLAAMYDGQVTQEKSKEPAQNPNLTQVAASQTGILPYQNQREFKQERNDPRFHIEPAFRDMVQKRMSMTDWNTLPV